MAIEGFDKDLVRDVFDQLSQQIRKQDDLVHSWTKYYLTIQAALAVALSFLIVGLGLDHAKCFSKWNMIESEAVPHGLRFSFWTTFLLLSRSR
jgi:hypothetical protein